MSEYSKLSKEIGWKLDMIKEYPTLEEVAGADNKQVLTWHRYLRGPMTETETTIITAIMSRVFKLKVHDNRTKESTNGCDMQ